MGPYLRNKGLLFWQIVPQLWGKTLVLFLALYTVLMLAGGVLHYFLQPQTPGFEWHQLSDGLALCLTAATVTSLAWFAYLHLYGPWKQGRVMQHPHLAPLRKAGFRLAMLPRNNGLDNQPHLEGLWEGYYVTIFYEMEAALDGCLILQVHYAYEPSKLYALLSVGEEVPHREFLPYVARASLRTGYGVPEYERIARELNALTTLAAAAELAPGVWPRLFRHLQQGAPRVSPTLPLPPDVPTISFEQ